MHLVRRFKLQDFCLQVVFENLEKYVGNKNIPQRLVDFLLRLYSKDVFKKFISFTNISEDQMLWFLNPHSKKITLCRLSERIMNRLKVVGQTITSLSLQGTLASENMINSVICCVPTVTHLCLSSSFCSDKTLLCIQRMCPFLKKLDLQDCRRITDKGMKNLCGPNKPLKHLNLLGTSVDLDGVYTVLKGMPSLQCVKYCEMADVLYDLHAQDFQNNTYSDIEYDLTELLYECEGMHDPVKVLSAWTVLCPNVTKLHIKFNATIEMLEVCSNFKHVEDLQISFPEDSWIDEIYSSHSRIGEIDRAVYVDDTLAPFMNSSRRLTTLTLCNVIVSLDTLVQCYKSVKNLTLRRVTFGDLGEEVRLQENNLDFLHMRSITLSIKSNCKAVCYLLSASKNVTKLRVNSFRDLPQEAFDVILKTMKKLEFVDFSFTPIKTSSVLKFLEIPTMKAVYLDVCYNLKPFDKSDLKNFIREDYACTFRWRLDYSNGDSDDEC